MTLVANTRSAIAPGRLGALPRYTDLIAVWPSGCAQEGLDDLATHGLAPQDVVALTQLVAFMPYQVRPLAGLRAMAGVPRSGPAASPRHVAPKRFTLEEVG